MTERYKPPAIAPPKGLTGLIEGYQYEPGSVMDTSSFPSGMVLLHVYDVSDGDLFTKINNVTTAGNNVLVAGVFHAGVEIYGKEWCYGVTEPGRSGVAYGEPRTHPQHTYRCTVPLRPTELSEQRVTEVLSRLAGEWPGSDYDLIHHNCISFCNALLRELIPDGRVPGWVDRGMRAAGFIDKTSKKVSQDAEYAKQVMRSMSTDLEQKVRGLGESSVDENLEVARKQSEELAAKASDHFNWLAASAQKSWESQSQELPPEVGEKAELVRRKTQEFGASLWSWGQDLHSQLSTGEATSNLQASLASLAEKTGFEAPGAQMAPVTGVSTKCHLDEDDDLLIGNHEHGERDGGMGLIRSAEASSMKRGLLDDDEEDEEDKGTDLIGLAAALKESNSSGYATGASATASAASAVAPTPQKEEAKPAASTGDIWDMLGPADEHKSHTKYGTVDANPEPWFDKDPSHAARPKAVVEQKPVDPLDGLDLLN